MSKQTRDDTPSTCRRSESSLIRLARCLAPTRRSFGSLYLPGRLGKRIDQKIDQAPGLHRQMFARGIYGVDAEVDRAPAGHHFNQVTTAQILANQEIRLQ